MSSYDLLGCVGQLPVVNQPLRTWVDIEKPHLIPYSIKSNSSRNYLYHGTENVSIAIMGPICAMRVLDQTITVEVGFDSRYWDVE